MKLPLLQVALALVAAPIAALADGSVKIDLDKPAETAPVKKPDDKNKPQEKKPAETVGKIEGVEVKRGDGFMGIAVVGGNFKLTFYDAKKKPVPVPAEVARAILRWMPGYAQKDERAVLNPSEDGKFLTSTKVVKPPLVFVLHVILQASIAGDENPSESYTVNFKGY